MQENIDLSAPEVTVCIVTYNQQRYITECLDSVLSQVTSFAFDVIVADDGSTDGTREILTRYSENHSNIKLVFRDENLGALRNFVATHDLATGKFVCHLDGDDRWLQGKLEAQYKFLTENVDFNACWTRTNLFNDEGWFQSGKSQNLDYFPNLEVSFEKALRVGIIAPHCSLMYRKSSRVKTFEPSERIDLFYTWQYLSTGKGKVLEHCLSEYRLSSVGAITRNSGTKIKQFYVRHAAHFIDMYPQHKNDIFVFVFLNFLLDIKNRRDTAYNFFKLSLRTLSFRAISIFIFDVRGILKMRPRG